MITIGPQENDSLHSLPLHQQFLDTSIDTKMDVQILEVQ